MKPHYRLTTPIGEGEATKWKEIGAGWENKDHSISIVLNAFVHVNHEVKMILYPWTEKPTKSTQSSTGG